LNNPIEFKINDFKERPEECWNYILEIVNYEWKLYDGTEDMEYINGKFII
jgi:hypothetical protein